MTGIARHSLAAATLAVAVAAFAAAPGTARAHEPAPPGGYVGRPAAPAPGFLGTYFGWKRVWVGDTRSRDRWRCQVRAGDTLYMSSATTVGRARAKLRPYTDTHIYCRRIEPFVFWW